MKKCFSTFFLLFLASGSMYAQYARTSYFMDNVAHRQQLNPALTPQQGYFNIPVIGSVNASVSSNSLGSSDIIDVIKNESGNEFFMNDKFYNALKPSNKINASVATDIIAFGWYKGKGFWNVNVSVKADAGADISKNTFQLMRDARGMNTLDWSHYTANLGHQKIHINSYLEAGVGYARPIGDRLTVGGKLKMLFGAANLKMDARKIEVKTDLQNIDAHQNWDD